MTLKVRLDIPCFLFYSNDFEFFFFVFLEVLCHYGNLVYGSSSEV